MVMCKSDSVSFGDASIVEIVVAAVHPIDAFGIRRQTIPVGRNGPTTPRRIDLIARAGLDMSIAEEDVGGALPIVKTTHAVSHRQTVCGCRLVRGASARVEHGVTACIGPYRNRRWRSLLIFNAPRQRQAA